MIQSTVRLFADMLGDLFNAVGRRSARHEVEIQDRSDDRGVSGLQIASLLADTELVRLSKKHTTSGGHGEKPHFCNSAFPRTRHYQNQVLQQQHRWGMIFRMARFDRTQLVS